MRRPVLALAALAVVLVAAVAPAAAADVTRTLKGTISPGPGENWAVENLAGRMSITAGSGSTVTATVTVHGGSDELASLIKVEQVVGNKGRMTLRVIYPLDQHTTYRYSGNGKTGGQSFWGLFDGGTSTLEYAGRRVKVSGKDGVLLYADVEVQVPARLGPGHLRNSVGRIDARGIEGDLTFDTASGDLDLKDLKGKIGADTGSGDVHIADVTGSLDCDTGSGDVTIEGFEGDLLSADVGSGDISIRAGKVDKVDLDTGSGDVNLKSADVGELRADTGSGDVTFDIDGGALTRAVFSTGSGDVRLRLGPNASFEARVSQGSGDMDNRLPDAVPIVRGREVVGYKRGDGRAKIDVSTGSGDFVIEPGTASASRR